MHADYQQLMVEATRLTQSGDLGAATALIQRALNGGSSPDVASTGPVAPRAAATPDSVIDVVARVMGKRPAEPDATTPAPHAAPAQAGGSQSSGFISGSFSHPAAGQRAYKLFVPPESAEPQRALPLVVMLHGCTQDPDDFARGTRMNEAAKEQGFFVLYPGQSSDMNPQRCWNWFKHNHQLRDHGEPALLAALVEDIAGRYAIDRSRIYVAGLSAGGAMAAILGETRPDLFAAVGVHSGLAAGAATDLPSAFGAMQNGGNAVSASVSKVPTIVFHGDADYTVNVKNAEQVIAASVGTDAQVQTTEEQSAGKRRSTRRVYRDREGNVTGEVWTVRGAPHAWAGGSQSGSFTDQSGPDATAEMLRFFMEHPLPAKS